VEDAPTAIYIDITWSNVAANNTAAALQAILRTKNTALRDFSGWFVCENAAYAASRPTTSANFSSLDGGNELSYNLVLANVAGNATNTSRFPLSYAELTSQEDYWSEEDGFAVVTPYLEDDLDYIQFAQTPDTMYLSHYKYAPRKVARASTGIWTVATYSRTNDPFVAGSALTINAITLTGTDAYVGFATPATLYGDQPYAFASIVGTTELNGNTYYLEPDPAPPFGTLKAWLLDPDTGLRIPSAGLSSYVSGGTATPAADNPIGVCFYESRLMFAGTNRRPRTVFGSRSSVSTTGAARLDDFTGGSDADHAVFFTLSPLNGSIDYISWAGGTPKHMLVGTFGGPFRISGGGLDEPITPSSINVRPLDAYGCASSAPALNGSYVYYIQRGGTTIRALRYDVDVDDVSSYDICMNADQIGESEITRIVLQNGKSDYLWAIRADGQLCGCTIQGPEKIAGWHRHKIGGTAAKVLDAAVLPRPGQSDQLYVVTERTVNGSTFRAIEAMADDVAFPDIENYYGVAATEALDAAAYRTAAVALKKTAVHLDAYETYNSTPATTISGLDHLEGETVTALADGVEVPDLVVSSGAITLQSAASVVHVGLPYTGYIQTQNLEVGGRSGPAQGKPRNICGLNIRFLNSLGGEYGTNLYHMQTIEDSRITLADGAEAPVYSGIFPVQVEDNWSTENDRNEKTVFVRQAAAYPCVVQFIDIQYDTGDE
jgi:hypothetical protein